MSPEDIASIESQVQPKRRPTMHDIARAAGVSRTAVSLVLGGRETRIAPETQERIRRAAKELEFRPSRAALQLRTQESKTVALIGDEIATGPFAGGLIAGAQAAAAEGERALIVLNTGKVGDIESVSREMLEDRQVDGIVLATVMTRQVSPTFVTQLAPTVLLNCFTSPTTMPEVVPNDLSGGYQSAMLVLSQGHRRVAFVTGERDTYPAEERLKGYRQALAEHQIDFDDSLVRYGDWTAAPAYVEAFDLLSSLPRPTAILCGNDRIALGVYDAARDLGMKVPTDVSVVGYDDQREIAAFMHPPLTTIRLPYEEMGRIAVEALDRPGTPQRILVDCIPVERGSVGPPSLASVQL